MAVPLKGARKPPPKPAQNLLPRKYGPTSGPWTPQAPKKPAYNWTGAANVNWFPGLAGKPPGYLTPAIQQMIGGAGAGAMQNLTNPYRNMIGGDWEVQGAESEMNARMGRARGDFQSQLRQMLIDLGVTDKSKLGNLGQYIDADTVQKAAENKYSQTAQISQAETAKRAQTEAALAARGMLSSGQLTKSTEDILAEGEAGRYGALRDFLSGGAQGLSSLADLNDQLASQVAQARFAAAARAADLYNSAEMWDWENQMGRYAPPPAAASPYTFAAGPGWGASVGNTGADRYGYSPKKPNRPGQPGFRPY